MPDASHLAALIAILSVAMFARSAFGFGHGAFAMPLMLLVVDIRTATPLLAAVSFVVGLWIVIGEWRNIRFAATARLTIGALIGIPIGILALLVVNQHLMLIALATVLSLVSVRGLAGVQLPELRDDRLAGPVGLIAGICGGAVNISGVPVAIYGAMRRWSPAEFRTSFTGFFLITGTASLIGYVVSGLFTPQVWPLFAWCIGPAFVGNWIGKHANLSMPRRVFDRAIWGVILVTALLLLAKQVL